jgi:hypothetical protein
MPFEISPAQLVVVLATIGVVVAIPIVAVVGVIRLLGLRRDPVRVLEMRLARGEISPSDFDTARRALGR